jgi:aspartate aminotransferase
LKDEGFPVDAIPPQAAIYLTVKFDLKGRSVGGRRLTDQAAVTSYILDEAKLAVVPFHAFGSSSEEPWYRLSVGTVKIEDIHEMFQRLREALQRIDA